MVSKSTPHLNLGVWICLAWIWGRAGQTELIEVCAVEIESTGHNGE